ncbi:hypothetical protein EIN_113870 [Entamoeba invadens IP1]|uniref:L-dopachrome isomerase n=1 Tax=Entamoeba invadens IP1 TaxID=370355 RepID=A0A0A1TXZ0_ENTIV|nr:hypothetical protein EIN_113870 [Entamoeba invadens IP1]ELP86263.1 hypothetical protein EIN_113870 [Entamoeba invadens IP1]|eukprot:XP_004185609.1 hypothetical protein EIN_113870 [Entamoeba invadens IP1]
MPIALIKLNSSISTEVQKEIVEEAMKILSDTVGKPILYCSTQLVMSIGGFGGSAKDSAFIDIRSIGGLKGKQEPLSARFCKMLEEKAGIKGDNIYLNFTEFSTNNWGFNHETF